ncbi:amino acid transporter [Ascodesmis nigricans]|uniref:Amino acid transporter n=1 Tax=Ascodesmis nigricans TaxID=341454 RepID=A0A4S2MJ88_9PEZI|nr:amino acid transporter [Ascodesmis nigricans]
MDRDRVEYKPIPEKRKLGYFSTASLIISKMIGTGVFAKPSVVLANSGGRGISLFLWVACGIMSLMGLLIYVEMGIAMPFSGAEVIYVEECYQRPRYLAVIVVGILFVLLTHFAGNCIAFAKLVLQAFEPGDVNPDYRLQKFVALCLLTFVCLLHTFSTKWGLAVNNLLAIYKVTLVTFIILVGFAAMGGARGKGVTWGDNEHYGLINFENAMVTQPKSMLEYASAILGVLWAYTGWENANYVLSEVRRPRGRESSVFKVASFSAISIVTVLYVLANVAYFTVLTDEEMLEEGEMVAAKFFNKVFGEGWVVQRGLKVMVALSILGNFVSSTYGLARVKQEIAKMRILPFSKFFARQSHYNTPVGALVLHWIVAATFIVSLSNKDDAAYNLITDLFIYGQNWMIILVTIGVLCLRYRQTLPNARRVDPNVTIPPPPPGTTQWSPSVLPWRFLLLIIMIYVPLNLFIIILTWWPPVKQTSIPSYVTPGVATGIIVAGVGYWVVFAKIMPAVGYHIDSAPDELIDGSRIVTYKRYKTGWAKWASDTVAKWTTKEKD